MIFLSKPPSAVPWALRALGTASGGLLRKITRSNPSQASENPLPTSVLDQECLIPVLTLLANTLIAYALEVGKEYDARKADPVNLVKSDIKTNVCSVINFSCMLHIVTSLT